MDSNATRLYTWKARQLKYAAWPGPALVNFAFMHPSGERVEQLSIMQNGEIAFNDTTPHGLAKLH